MITWITTPITTDILRGAAEGERTEHGLRPHRLPGWARAQSHDPQLHLVEAQPSGGRVCFRTAATAIELDTVATRRVFTGLPAQPPGRYDLLVDGRLAGRDSVPGGNVVNIDMTTLKT